MFIEIENLLNEVIIEDLDYKRNKDISLKWNNKPIFVLSGKTK